VSRAARRRLARADDAYEPTVAVVVPLYNEGPIIQRTIACILAQKYPARKLGVVVVDDCSTDDSYELARAAAARAPGRVTVLRNPENRGKRRSINAAVRDARAEIIVSVDSDALIEEHAIARLVRRFVAPEIAAVGGRVHVLNANDNWLTRMQTIKYFMGYQYLKNFENAFLNVMCLSGCLTAYRRSVLLELEPVLEARNVLGVPIKYGEDRFLTRQIVKAGYRTRLSLDAMCYTKAPETLPKLFAQQLRWRRSNLVDFLCGMSHGWRMPPLVAVHYFALFALMIVYPLFLIGAILDGTVLDAVLVHLGLLAVYGLVYRANSRDLAPELRVHPIYFLPMAVVMPVTYVVITVLALFTLDSDSWETRGAASPLAARPPTP
jgi:cellulose synthase/poly-beta-1,6-N-acetylglucosamine synthase-like glycosyltransferase